VAFRPKGEREVVPFPPETSKQWPTAAFTPSSPHLHAGWCSGKDFTTSPTISSYLMESNARSSPGNAGPMAGG
jgi:hypothetical protein